MTEDCLAQVRGVRGGPHNIRDCGREGERERLGRRESECEEERWMHPTGRPLSKEPRHGHHFKRIPQTLKLKDREHMEEHSY